MDSLIDNIDCPYVDLTLTGVIKDDLNKIVKSLMRTCHGNTDLLKYGVVVIRNSFNNFNSPEEAVMYYNSIKHGITCYVDKINKKIDFSNLTFVTSFDCDKEVIDNDRDNFLAFLREGLGFSKTVECHKLTDKEKYNLLVKVPNSRLHLYNSIYNAFGTKITIDDDAVELLIKIADEFKCGLTPATQVLDLIVKHRVLQLRETDVNITESDIMFGFAMLANSIDLNDNGNNKDVPRIEGGRPQLKLEGGKKMENASKALIMAGRSIDNNVTYFINWYRYSRRKWFLIIILLRDY